MAEQNFKNHSRYVPGYHIVLLGLVLAGLVASLINWRNQPDGDDLSAKLISLLFACMFLLAFYARAFALKAQDRAIRAEERFRYFSLSGKFPSQKLSVRQFTALRFAPDEEFVQLADRAASEDLSSKEIKKQIANWRADYYRV